MHLASCVHRYAPTQAFNFAFKDTIKNMFPSYSPKVRLFQCCCAKNDAACDIPHDLAATTRSTARPLALESASVTHTE